MKRWTDADLRAAWEAGVKDGESMLRAEAFSEYARARHWKKSAPRAQIRALEIANAGIGPRRLRDV